MGWVSVAHFWTSGRGGYVCGGGGGSCGPLWLVAVAADSRGTASRISSYDTARKSYFIWQLQ